MKIIEHLKHLDHLIVESTMPPATPKLRNYLSTIIEQAETEGDLPDVMAKKDAAHAGAMAQIQNENAALQQELATLKAQIKQSQDWQRLTRESHIEATYAPENNDV